MIGRAAIELKAKLRRGKGRQYKRISIYQKLKSVLRKVFVNGKEMRKASVLKQNKYRKK